METLYTTTTITTTLLLYELHFHCIGNRKLSYCPLHKTQTIHSCFPNNNTCDRHIQQIKQRYEHAVLYTKRKQHYLGELHIQHQQLRKQQQRQQQRQQQFHCLCKHNKQQEKYHQIIPLTLLNDHKHNHKKNTSFSDLMVVVAVKRQQKEKITNGNCSLRQTFSCTYRHTLTHTYLVTYERKITFNIGGHLF